MIQCPAAQLFTLSYWAMRWLYWLAVFTVTAVAGERQLTTSARNHALDNNDNFSADDRFLCVDTRGTGWAILRVNVATGAESVVYEAGPQVVAASYSPVADEIIFIHGPFDRPYAKTDRLGAVVPAGGGKARFLDVRDVVSDVTPAGAHRGGTHRHEYSLDGKRVAFTYDDHLLPAYGRTIGMLVPRPGKWFFVNLVPVVPEAEAKAGDIVMAAGDSWVGSTGTMRAFIGKVKEADGTFRSSLFVLDIPANLDVTTAYAGDRKTYPKPPRGVKIRRLTTGDAYGIARGSRDGKWIAYLADAADGTRQVFVVPSAGGAAKQVTAVEGGVAGAVRWHPSGRYVAAATRKGIVAAEVATGKTRFLTEKAGDALVWSNNGKLLAFNRKVGAHLQVFLVDFDVAGSGF